jgi:hypothetical protein
LEGRHEDNLEGGIECEEYRRPYGLVGVRGRETGADEEGAGVPHIFHFMIKSDGFVFGKDGKNYGNLFDYLP